MRFRTLGTARSQQALARRRTAERALAESDERHRSFFEHHPHAVFALDPRGCFVQVNRAVGDLVGYCEGELQGTYFGAIVLGADLARAEEAFRTVTVDHTPDQFVARVRHKAGDTVEVRVTSMPVVVDGELVGVHGIAEDLTEVGLRLRELDEARRAAEHASEAKSLFLANVSHEIRTPLTTLLGVIEMLLEEELDPTHARLVAAMHRSGDRLHNLVGQILDFSKIEAGHATSEVVTYEPRDILDDVAETVGEHARRKGLVFRVECAPQVPRRAHGDPTQLCQVLANVLDNAVKFTESGEVVLTASAERDGDGRWITYTVRDTGIGIPEEHLGGLFEPFTQADPSITRRYGGTGLGLAICRQLVELLGGEIRCESVAGAGTTFVVRVPVRSPGPRAVATPA